MRVGDLSMYAYVTDEDRTRPPFDQVDFDAEVDDPGPVTRPIVHRNQALADKLADKANALTKEARKPLINVLIKESKEPLMIGPEWTEEKSWISLKRDPEGRVVIHAIRRPHGRTRCGRVFAREGDREVYRGAVLTDAEVQEFGDHARPCRACAKSE